MAVRAAQELPLAIDAVRELRGLTTRLRAECQRHLAKLEAGTASSSDVIDGVLDVVNTWGDRIGLLRQVPGLADEARRQLPALGKRDLAAEAADLVSARDALLKALVRDYPRNDDGSLRKLRWRSTDPSSADFGKLASAPLGAREQAKLAAALKSFLAALP